MSAHEPPLEGWGVADDARPRGLSRGVWIGLAALLVGAGVCWLRALTGAVNPLPPVMVVRAPTLGVGGAWLPLVVYAIDPVTQRVEQGRFAASIDGGTEQVFEQVTHLPLPAGNGESVLEVRGPLGGTPARVRVPIERTAVATASVGVRFVPWSSAIRQGVGPPLYPSGKGVSTSFPSTLVEVGAGPDGPALEILPQAPNPAEVRDRHGRILVLDRTPLRLEGPREVPVPGVLELEVQRAQPGRLWADLVVDGQVRSVAFLERSESTVRLEVPADVRPDAVLVAHVADRPHAGAEGAVFVARALGGEGRDASTASRDLARWAVTAARRAGAPADEPLALALDEGRVAPEDLLPATEALLARLAPIRRRAERVGPSSTMQLDQAKAERLDRIGTWRWPFRIFGGLFALAVAGVAAVASARRARWLKSLRDPEAPREPRRVRWLGALWAVLALSASLVVLWVLDWVLGFGL